MSKRCLIIGAVMLDISVSIPRFPQPGDDIEIAKQTIALGGCAYNVSQIMQHFHAAHDLFAPIGKGPYADRITHLLSQSGVKPLIQTCKADNGYCMCLIPPDGERTFLTLPGIETHFDPDWFHNINPEDYDKVYVCGYELENKKEGASILSFLEGHPEYTLFYAPGPRINSISPELHQRLFALHPIVHLNLSEALSFTGSDTFKTAAIQLHNLTGNDVIITLGTQGSYLKGARYDILVPSISQTAVDTTGAGDSHIGAVISAISLGKNIQEAVRIANRVASAVVTVTGPVLTKEQFDLLSL